MMLLLTQLCHLMELKALRPLLHMQGRVEDIHSLDFLTLMDMPDNSPYFTSDNFRLRFLSFQYSYFRFTSLIIGADRMGYLTDSYQKSTLIVVIIQDKFVCICTG